MAPEKGKKRIVFLEEDTIRNLKTLAQMHLDSNGTPRVLQFVPLSEEFAESIRRGIAAMEKVLEEADEEGK